jgi:hypothetical protein
VEAPLRDYPGEAREQHRWALIDAKDCAEVLMSQRYCVVVEGD